MLLRRKTTITLFQFKPHVFLIILFIWSSHHQLAAEGRFQSLPELIQTDGYPVEIHHVVTEDGYILELHRIPNGRFGSSTPSPTGRRKPVIVFAHCLLASAAVFVVLGPTTGLAYIMANFGFDVWLINMRGTEYSQNHISLSPQSPQFWKFSWHEIGIYDVPAGIDYALQVTGETQVDYVGLSMGTTMFFVLMSERPEYNQKIRNMIALAPVVYVNASTNLLGKLMNYYMPSFKKYKATDLLEVPPPEFHLKELFSALCKNARTERSTLSCKRVLFLVTGTKDISAQTRSLEYFFRYFPESTSLRTLIHYEQLIKSGAFRKYDFGAKMNMIEYGANEPPEYDLTKVKTNVSLFWSQGDTVATAEDIARLRDKLPNIVFDAEISSKKFVHFDFVWSKKAHKMVYGYVTDLLKQVFLI